MHRTNTTRFDALANELIAALGKGLEERVSPERRSCLCGVSCRMMTCWPFWGIKDWLGFFADEVVDFKPSNLLRDYGIRAAWWVDQFRVLERRQGCGLDMVMRWEWPELKQDLNLCYEADEAGEWRVLRIVYLEPLPFTDPTREILVKMMCSWHLPTPEAVVWRELWHWAFVLNGTHVSNIPWIMEAFFAPSAECSFRGILQLC